MTKEDDKRIDWLKFINTTIITIILGVSILCFTGISSLKEQQIEVGKELVRLKTIQDANTLAITILNGRVGAIETNQSELIKSWVELNFMRKTQK